MATLLENLRDGAFVTRERARLVAFAVLTASLIGLVYILATATGLNDYSGRPIGSDFSNIYAAGTYVLDGEAAKPFDPAAQHAREQAIFGAATPFYGWHYPPFFLGLAALLATMPYLMALAVWQGATLVLYLLAMRAILNTPSWPGLSRPSTSSFAEPPQGVDARHKAGHDEGEVLEREKLWLLLAIAYPAVFINLGHGHNGFLTAALFAAALLTLDSRPVLSGILIGCLAYKPQFGLLIPLVLVATGRWRVFAAAAATVAIMALAVTAAFGVEVWHAFLASSEFTRHVVLEQGGTGWHKIQSTFAWARMWGAGLPLAYAVQTATTVAVAAALVVIWRGRSRFAVKAAALLIGSILATPYSLDYDLMLIAPAIAFLAADAARRGAAPKNVPWEKTLLAALWIVPLVARSFAQLTHIPLGAPVMLLSFGWLLYRALRTEAPGIIESQAA
ncbi:glycosyltransferase family 87 protein [Pseudolabrys sp. FHR47]|uniref:glycosyltransferase family 87 protein n=1 Tax=Pseudolabrys sp. FHR47 TaxID=2562284 RepID=UPI0010BE25E5|nr:glycosyltransferase family 87 protein [Pseudolabrys sp. FHR47]